MSTVMYFQPATRRQPGGLPGAVVRAGRLLELWGYRAARPQRPRTPVDRAEDRRTAIDESTFRADRLGGASSLMSTRPRIY